MFSISISRKYSKSSQNKMSFFITVSYERLSDNGYCGINTHSSNAHESCQCSLTHSGTQGSGCKTLCNLDSTCKAYSFKSKSCRIYTTEPCPSDCPSKHNTGVRGSITNRGESFHLGCYRKVSGNLH